MKKTSISRLVFEMSLKPFKETTPEAIQSVCRTALSQWHSLIKDADTIALLLWVAEGSEILTWRGDLEEELEWARYIGYMNDRFNRPDRVSNPVTGRPYIDRPAIITYQILRDIISEFKRIAATEFGKTLEVGATFDLGPEFARSDFKYNLHPEVTRAFVNGREITLTKGAHNICSWAKLDADQAMYAAYPEGIPQDTSIGEFLGRQSQHFMHALGYNYIWFSNGFGFSCLPWTYLGVNFDGEAFNLSDYGEIKHNLIAFWSDFRNACEFPVEVRGTNFGTAMDIASDLVPLRDLYEKKFFRYPPPNSPWGALDNDFGLEIVGHMSRIAELPGTTYPFRYYMNDPWYWQNPWWDYYNREPFDIYCPLSVSRIGEDGEVENPKVLEMLTLDTEQGQLNENCPAEVIPHIKKAIQDYPDEPGILTWLYPFDEFHSIAERRPDLMSCVFLGDWLIRNAINKGFPLNTVISTRTFSGLDQEKQKALQNTILCTPAFTLDDDQARCLHSFISEGGKVLLYGPVISSELSALLNLKHVDALEGECVLSSSFHGEGPPDEQNDLLFWHDPLISGGGLTDTIASEDLHTSVRATARQGDKSRIFSLFRSIPQWQGGAVGWVRGSLPFDTRNASDSPVSLPENRAGSFVDTSILLRHILQDFGYAFIQKRDDISIRETMNFISRHDNGFYFSGCKQNTNVVLQYSFPDGAPIITGKDTIIREGKSSYFFDKTFHNECRIFVRQSDNGPLTCREVAPRPTELKKQVERRIRLKSLQRATVTIYPPLGKLHAGLVEVNNSESLPGSMFFGEDYLDLSNKIDGNRIILENISGALEVSW